MQEVRAELGVGADRGKLGAGHGLGVEYMEVG